MTRKRIANEGFGALEGILIVVIVAAVIFVGWYIWNARNNTNKVLSTVNSSSSNVSKPSTQAGNSPGSKDNVALQSDLNSIGSSSTASNQDLNNSSSSLNDQSTFTTVPQ